jgi:hypothetical protein
LRRNSGDAVFIKANAKTIPTECRHQASMLTDDLSAGIRGNSVGRDAQHLDLNEENLIDQEENLIFLARPQDEHA